MRVPFRLSPDVATTTTVGSAGETTLLETVATSVPLVVLCLLPMMVGLTALYGAQQKLRDGSPRRIAAVGYVVAVLLTAVVLLPEWRQFGGLLLPIALLVAGTTTVGLVRPGLSVGRSTLSVTGLLVVTVGISTAISPVLLGLFPFYLVVGLLFPLGKSLRAPETSNGFPWTPLLVGVMVATVGLWLFVVLTWGEWWGGLLAYLGAGLTGAALLVGAPLFALGISE